MKKLLSLTLLLLLIKLLSAQDKWVDSLKLQIPRAKQDTNKVRLLESIGRPYSWSYPDTSIKYNTLAYDLAQRLRFKAGIINALVFMGVSYAIKGDYPRSLKIELHALQLAEGSGNKEEIHNCYFATAESYLWSRNYQKSLDYYYLLKTQRSAFTTTEQLECYLDGFIGKDFFHLNKLDSATYYIRRSYLLDLKQKQHWAVVYQLLAELCAQKGRYREAVNYVHPYLEELVSYNLLASIYNKMGMTDSAVYFAKKAIQEGSKASMSAEIFDASRTLTGIYTSKGEIDSAFKYQGIMVTANDSLFSTDKVINLITVSNKEDERKRDLAAARQQYETRIRIYLMLSALVAFLIVGAILFRNNRLQKKANAKIQRTLAELKQTQTQLIQSEKMASLGELTAGIAHEIQNPLNFVNNFSEVNREMLEELKAESEKPKAERDEQLEVELINDLIENEQKINHHGKRADGIVKGMLEHSRSGRGQKEPTDLNVMADEYMRLAYHGLRSKDKSFNAELVTHFDKSLPKINVIPQDIGRVLLNLFNNAFYAVNQKQKIAGEDYKPEVSVATSIESGQVIIRVEDNGIGIPDAIKDKIMQPFFTTKPTGEGTGLGLSLTYDMVVKAHGGSIEVNSIEGEGSEFIIALPLK